MVRRPRSATREAVDRRNRRAALCHGRVQALPRGPPLFTRIWRERKRSSFQTRVPRPRSLCRLGRGGGACGPCSRRMYSRAQRTTTALCPMRRALENSIPFSARPMHSCIVNSSPKAIGRVWILFVLIQHLSAFTEPSRRPHRKMNSRESLCSLIAEIMLPISLKCSGRFTSCQDARLRLGDRPVRRLQAEQQAAQGESGGPRPRMARPTAPAMSDSSFAHPPLHSPHAAPRRRRCTTSARPSRPWAP